MGSNDTACEDLLGLFIKDPKGEGVTNVVCNAKPTSRALLSVGPRLFMVQEQEGLPESELEEGGDIRSGALHILEGCHGVREGGVCTDVVDISNTLSRIEPKDPRSASTIKDFVDLVLEVADGIALNWVLLWVVGFGELIFD